jgi:phosphate transport system ATP-binding protein
VFFTPFLPRIFDQTGSVAPVQKIDVLENRPGVALVLIALVLLMVAFPSPSACCGEKEMVAAKPIAITAAQPPVKLEVRGHHPLRPCHRLDKVSLDPRARDLRHRAGQCRQELVPEGAEPHGHVHFGMRVDGEILFNGRDIRRLRNVYALRSRIGVVFPLPVGLPMTVYDNVALAPRLAGIRNRTDLDIIVERCLARAALWDEVKDRLNSLGSLLSGGQQQRLTIARALSQDPEVLMLDEFSIAWTSPPCASRTYSGTLREMTIILVTNLVQQARRLAQRTAFFLDGACVEIGETEALFSGEVKDPRTRDYVEGRFG